MGVIELLVAITRQARVKDGEIIRFRLIYIELAVILLPIVFVALYFRFVRKLPIKYIRLASIGAARRKSQR
jgi:uncharacterized membrane protein YhdT